MYVPEHFRIRHHEDTVAFLRANPFAILISSTGSGPYATHLPLSIHAEEVANGNEPGIVLRGHVSKANPHWQHLQQNPQCLAIFHGPHAYISPTNYTARESVPTWNYAAVHIYGEAKIFFSESELHGMLGELIETFEPSYRAQWETLDAKFRDNMLRQIVGFQIAASKVEGKFKLSQNRIKQDQANVIASLEKSPDCVISGVAEMMKEQGLGLSVSAKRSEKEK